MLLVKFSWVIVVLTIGAIIYYVGRRVDKYNWNNGVCRKCNKGFWVAFDVDSSGATGYKCSYCDNSHWQNSRWQKEVSV